MIQTRDFVNNALRDGAGPTTGTIIARTLPPISRFAVGNNHAVKKQATLAGLVACFDRYSGLHVGGTR